MTGGSREDDGSDRFAGSARQPCGPAGIDRSACGLSCRAGRCPRSSERRVTGRPRRPHRMSRTSHMNDISRRTLIAAGTALAAGGARAADGPTPERAGKGADVLGPRNPAREAEEPNTVAPPTTDHGTMPNLKWSFADSHMRLEEGGWARQITMRELPISKAMAGVNMRLKRRRGARDALAQGGRVVLHAQGPRPDHRGRRGGPQLRRRRRRGRPVVLPVGHPALDPGARVDATAASSCWCSTTAASRRIRPS